MVSHVPRTALRLTLIALVCGIASVRCAPTPPADATDFRGLLGELARSGLTRTLAPRLSIPLGYQPCSLRAPEDGTIPLAQCAADPAATSPDEILDLAARAHAQVHAEVDPDALHTVALIDLLWADGAGISLRRSISNLQTAWRLAERSAPMLADLAAAYLVRAERTQNPRDLLEAVEAAERALELEPRSAAARFNLALALDRLALDGQAAEAWEQYLMVDSTSSWAEEARERSQALASLPEPPAPPAPGASPAEVAAYVARAPQEARLLGWDRLLGEWGEAVLAGDSARAAERLRLAAALGEALERQGGDATLADAVRAIRASAGDAAGTRRLARGHREYALGQAALLAPNYERAHEHFTAALHHGATSGPLAGWVRLSYAVTLSYHGQPAQGERLLANLAAKVDRSRYPALAGRACSALGSVLYRSGRHEEASRRFGDAIQLLTRSSEHEHRGAVEAVATDLEFTTGNEATAYRRMHRALGTLRPYRGSVWLHSLLYVAAEEAAAAGLFHAALRLQSEGVFVTERAGVAAYVAEARLARARLRTIAGDSLQAREDVRFGERAVEDLPSGYLRSWMEAELQITRAVLIQGGAGAPVLDSVVAFFDEKQVPLRLLPALIARADARLTLGQPEAAQTDLNRAIAMLEAQRDATTRMPLYAALMDAARGVFDRMVMLHINAGRPAAALAVLQRGRAGFTRYAPVSSEGRNDRLAAPRDELAVEYALIGDTLLTWVVVDTVVHLTHAQVDRADMLRTIELARASLELRADTTARSALAALYDLLARPIERQLAPEGTPLAIITDGELAAVPFAALLDRRRDEYLIERHTLRFVSNLHHAVSVQGLRSGSSGTALLVANPAFDPSEHPDLVRLPGSHAEVETLAARYLQPVLLTGTEATRTKLREVFPQSAIVHYAGHAIFDDERPERSFLVLAPDEGIAGSGRMTASDIENLDLRNVRLVVLSACQTLRSQATRSGGFAGFANAVFAAGAGGIVGSLWRVDDRLTQPLMTEFHRAYMVSGDGAAALRVAQLALLHSPNPALRSPGAWAGFRYAGR